MNRCALPLEAARGVRRAWGEIFALGYSLIADELLPDEIALEESTAFAKMLQIEVLHFLMVL